MPRQFKDWLASYVEYASYTEAPKRMHFFAGVGVVAGALRRHVWIDQKRYKWYPNQYIILVAPPGVVNKSTTIRIATDLLRQVKGIGWGPSIMTWQALMVKFSEAMESFPVGDMQYTQCALTLEADELGVLLDPTNRELVDFLVSLWDSKTGILDKITKHVGNETVENPYINIIAGTTPSWIAGNFPDYLIGGGFTSRCLFVYADKKDRFIAYPGLHIRPGDEQLQAALVADLEHIATTIFGEYTLSSEAIAWGTEWYEKHSTGIAEHLSDERFAVYFSRKQTHMHKLAMVIHAATSDSMVIGVESLVLANTMLEVVEKDMPAVYAKIGRSEESIATERLLTYIRHRQSVPYAEAYRYIHNEFPNGRDFEGIIAGLLKSGLIINLQVAGGFMLIPGYQEATLPVDTSVTPLSPPGSTSG